MNCPTIRVGSSRVGARSRETQSGHERPWSSESPAPAFYVPIHGPWGPVAIWIPVRNQAESATLFAADAVPVSGEPVWVGSDHPDLSRVLGIVTGSSEAVLIRRRREARIVVALRVERWVDNGRLWDRHLRDEEHQPLRCVGTSSAGATGR
jgi:hypothetical protein